MVELERWDKAIELGWIKEEFFFNGILKWVKRKYGEISGGGIDEGVFSIFILWSIGKFRNNEIFRDKFWIVERNFL